MDVSMYFNQAAQLERFETNNNEFNTEEYSESIDIRARLEGNKKFYKNDDGSVTVSEHQCYTCYPVQVRDRISVTDENGNKLIDRQYIKSVKSIYDFDGSIIYYEAYL